MKQSSHRSKAAPRSRRVNHAQHKPGAASSGSSFGTERQNSFTFQNTSFDAPNASASVYTPPTFAQPDASATVFSFPSWSDLEDEPVVSFGPAVTSTTTTASATSASSGPPKTSSAFVAPEFGTSSAAPVASNSSSVPRPSSFAASASVFVPSASSAHSSSAPSSGAPSSSVPPPPASSIPHSPLSSSVPLPGTKSIAEDKLKLDVERLTLENKKAWVEVEDLKFKCEVLTHNLEATSVEKVFLSEKLVKIEQDLKAARLEAISFQTQMLAAK